MSDNRVKCSVNGMLRGGKAVCGLVCVGGEYCSRPLGECELQVGAEKGAANGVLAEPPTEQGE